MATAWIEIAHNHFQGFPARLAQLGIKANDFCHAAYADAVIKAGDGNLVSFIKDGRNWRPLLIRQGNS